jgi:Mn2+/Fe2+ NRAMP family transporter
LWVACGLLVTANVINIGADLGGMGEVAFMVTGIKPVFWTVSFTLVIVTFLFRSSYRQIARVFKWITLVLLSYVLTAFFAHVQWSAALLATVRPHLSWSREYLAMFVAVMGTTISPYLFFWQAAQEVEDGRIRRPEHERGKPAALRRLRMDVAVGMFFSNFIMYFIILTTAATLHAHETTQIETAGQAAEALRPLAGKAAYWLFTFGLIGTGMLGVPILAGSSAYALAEAAAWRGALQSKPHRAKEFYAVLAAAMTIGLAIDFLGLDAVKMLFLSAVVNGALAPPLILLVILLTNDPRVMGKHVNSPTMQALGWITFLVMSVAALGLLFS